MAASAAGKGPTTMKQENLEKITNLRHELHAHPELSMEEEWTRSHLMNFLRENTSRL